jgi:hypothetical protein
MLTAVSMKRVGLLDGNGWRQPLNSLKEAASSPLEEGPLQGGGALHFSCIQCTQELGGISVTPSLLQTQHFTTAGCPSYALGTSSSPLSICGSRGRGAERERCSAAPHQTRRLTRTLSYKVLC